jgi:hypothetical protein
MYDSANMVFSDKHHKVFSDILPGSPPNIGFEHIIELEEGVQVVITNHYRHPKVYKDEIEKTIKELLKIGHIRPSSSTFALFFFFCYNNIQATTAGLCFGLKNAVVLKSPNSEPESIYLATRIQMRVNRSHRFNL